MNKISCVMSTYGRATCVERSIAMFLAQDYEGQSELIVYNTDEEFPIVLSSELLQRLERANAWLRDYVQGSKSIKVINNNIDFDTHMPYTNIGAIRRDAVNFTSGDYYICWDDDDVFLPWNNRQCMDGILRSCNQAWKPIKSFFKTMDRLEYIQNTLEASVIVSMDAIRDIGFDLHTGAEHLAWYTKLRDRKELNENDSYSIPAYAFNWSDPEIAGHKQSGDINNPNNFENHKRASVDHATRPLLLYNLDETYKPFYDYFIEHPDQFNMDLLEKYVVPHLTK